MKLRPNFESGMCSVSRCKAAPSTIVSVDPFMIGLIPIRQTPFRNVYARGVPVCPKHAAGLPLYGMPEVSLAAAESFIAEVIPTIGVEAEIAANVLHAQASVNLAKEIRIETAEEYGLFCELLTETKAKLKALVAQKETITKPQRDALEAARALFRPAEAALVEAEAAIKSVIGDYTRREAAEKTKRLAEAAAAARAGDTEATEAALARVVNTKNIAPNVSTREVWEVESIDPHMVPNAFMIPDEKKIAAFARSHDPTKRPEICGVTFKLKTIVTGRGA